jgi:hypothetical protein
MLELCYNFFFALIEHILFVAIFYQDRGSKTEHMFNKYLVSTCQTICSENHEIGSIPLFIQKTVIIS